MGKIIKEKRRKLNPLRRKRTGKSGLLHLPREMLEKVLGNLSPWNGRRFRSISQDAKRAYDQYIDHQFKTVLNRCFKGLPGTLKPFTLLQVLVLALVFGFTQDIIIQFSFLGFQTVKVASRAGLAVGIFPLFLDKLLSSMDTCSTDVLMSKLGKYFDDVEFFQETLDDSSRKYLLLLNIIDLVKVNELQD